MAAPPKQAGSIAPRPARKWGWFAGLVAPVALGLPGAAIAGQSWPDSFLATWAGMVLLLLLGGASGFDLRFRKIPNWITYTALLWALALSAAGTFFGGPEALSDFSKVSQIAEREPFVPHLGSIAMSQALLGAAVCFSTMFVIFLLAGVGAGDVKMMTAVGALLGPTIGFQSLLWAYVVAGGAILAGSVWRHGPWTLIAALARKGGSLLLPLWVLPPSDDQQKLLFHPVPLAPAYSIGILLVLLVPEIRW